MLRHSDLAAAAVSKPSTYSLSVPVRSSPEKAPGLHSDAKSNYSAFFCGLLAITAIHVGMSITLLNGVMHEETFVHDFCTRQNWGNFFTCHAISLADQPHRFVVLKCLAMGIFLLCIAVSSLFAAPLLADQLGRVPALFIGNLFSIGGTIAVCLAHGQGIFLLGRVLDGLGIGVLAAVLPMYIAEMSPLTQRKAYGLITPIGFAVGLVAGLCFCYINREGWSWRYIMGIPIIFAGVMLLTCLAMPETPLFQDLRELRRRGAAAIDAQHIAVAHRSNVAVNIGDNRRAVVNDAEYEPVPVAMAHPTGLPHQAAEECERRLFWGSHLGRIFETPSLRKRLLLSTLGQWLQTWTGLNAFLFYGTLIYVSSGFFNALRPAIITVASAALGLILGAALIDMIPRRVIALVGGILLTLTVAAIAAIYHASIDYPDKMGVNDTKAAFCALVSFAAFLGTFTWGQLSWVTPAETFPAPYRATALGWTAANQWLAMCGLVFATPWIIRGIGVMGLFYVFTGVAAIGTILAGIFLPETLNVPSDSIAMDKLFVSERVDASHPVGHAYDVGRGIEMPANRHLAAATAAAAVPQARLPEKNRNAITDSARAVAEKARTDTASQRAYDADAAARRAREAYDSSKQSIESAARDAGDRMRDAGESVKQTFENAADRARQGIDSAAQKARDAVHDSSNYMHDETRRATDSAQLLARNESERARDAAAAARRSADQSIRESADAVHATADRVKQVANQADEEAKRAAERLTSAGRRQGTR